MRMPRWAANWHGFAELLRPIIESVDRFGLKARYLRKHQSAVERFFQALLRQDYQTDVATGYVRRFEKRKTFEFITQNRRINACKLLILLWRRERDSVS